MGCADSLFLFVVRRLRRPTGDETGALRLMLVLLKLHFCFFLEHGIGHAAPGK